MLVACVQAARFKEHAEAGEGRKSSLSLFHFQIEETSQF